MRAGSRASAVSVIILFAAITTAGAADAISDLGLTPGRAREAVFEALASGAVTVTGKAEAFTSASSGARVALVNGLGAFARTYVESADFATRYIDHREANAPDPMPETRSVDEILKRQRDEYEQQVEAMRKLFSEITPEQRTTLEQGFDEMRARFDQMETPAGRAELEEAVGTQRKQMAASRNAAVAQYEKLIPKDPRVLVAGRLRRFLDLTKDVAWDAKLVESGKLKKFADESLESRPAEWKMAYRAGRPATDAARAFAQKWLADLEKAGVQ